MPQFKTDGGTAQDMTPQVGAQTGAVESGAAGAGSGGNPDGGLGGNASFMQNNGPWSIQDQDRGGTWIGYAPYNPYFDPDTGKPISEAHQPGYGTSKAPQFAPPAAVDQAGIADQRLRDMWASHSWKGVKVHLQVGSKSCDDYRNPRLPLPQQPKSRFYSCWNGFGPWDTPDPDPHFEIYPMPFRPIPNPPAGPWPMLSNEYSENFNENDVAPSIIPGAAGADVGLIRHGGNTPEDEADKIIHRGTEESEILNFIGMSIVGELVGGLAVEGLAWGVGAVRAARAAKAMNNVRSATSTTNEVRSAVNTANNIRRATQTGAEVVEATAKAAKYEKGIVNFIGREGKLEKHLSDWDYFHCKNPKCKSVEEGVQLLKDTATEIVENADELRIGKWHDIDDAFFYRKDTHVVVTDAATGNFNTILYDAASATPNYHYSIATPVPFN